MKKLLFILIATFLFNPSLNAQDNLFSEGQIWEYKTRPQDKNSLLKIQKITQIEGDEHSITVYHISVIGISLQAPLSGDSVPHLPVSQETLDKSVTQLSNSELIFPIVDEGYQIWKSANGGVFTITIAEIIDIVDQSSKQQLEL